MGREQFQKISGALNHIKHFHKVPASRIKWTDLHTAGSKVEPEEASIQRRPEDIAREATPTQDKPKTRVDDLTIEKQIDLVAICTVLVHGDWKKMTTDNLDEPMKQGKAANQLQPGYEPASLKTLVRIVKLSKNKQQLLQPRQGSQASSQAAVSSNSLWTK